MSMITYANKETLNAQPSIADKNKCTANDMNEIKSVINNKVGDVTNLNTTNKTSIVGAINELKDGEINSTTEVKTNAVWTDGKPIYKKVIRSTLPSLQPSGGASTADGNVAHGISNLGHVISINGTLDYAGTLYWFPVLSSNGKITTIRYITSTNIILRTSDSWQSGPPVEFIMEYTKTTD
jgi:hypothetical protein